MDVQQVADRLIECEQHLASVPEDALKLQRALTENGALRAELESTRSSLAELTGSTSWRLTEPLRRVQALIRHR